MADWLSKVIEVHFTDGMKETANMSIDAQSIELVDVIHELCSDGKAVKVKWSEYYDAYTFSLTYPKDFKAVGGYTFWTLHGQVEKGLRVMLWLQTEVIPDSKVSDLKNKKGQDW